MSNDSATLIRNGKDFASKLNREQAIEQFQLAMEAEPNNIEAAFCLAYELDLAGEEEDALRMLEVACKQEPAKLNALVNLAILYEDNGEYSKAEACLKLVLDSNANHGRAHIFMKDVQASRAMYIEDDSKSRDFSGGVVNMPITDFELSARARNCLKKMGIRTLGDLLKVSEAELMAYKNFGETTLLEIKSLLDQRGYKLGQALDQKHAAAREKLYEHLTNAGDEQVAGILNQPVEDLQLSVRARNALSMLNVSTIGDLVSRTQAELLGIKNFGQTSLDEINECLASKGLSLRSLSSN